MPWIISLDPLVICSFCRTLWTGFFDLGIETASTSIAFGILIGALVVAAPWLILILARHEASNLLFAYSSHRNADFILSLNNISTTAQFIGGNLRYVTDNLFLTILALPGFLMLLIRKNFHLPLAFIFILFMGEASFYSQILASMMAAVFSAELLRLAPKFEQLKEKNAVAFLKTALVIIVALCLLFSSAAGLSQIVSYAPEIDNASLHGLPLSKAIRTPMQPTCLWAKSMKQNGFPICSTARRSLPPGVVNGKGRIQSN